MQEKLNILIVDPVHEYALETLKQRFNVTYKLKPEKEELINLIKDTDIIILRSGITLFEDVLSQAPKLKLIARAGAGVDNIDIDYATKKDITVFNIPALSAKSVAELAFGLMISVSRNIALADRWLRDNQWRKKDLYGYELSGKTLGIIGLGNIGSEVAKIAKGFDMNILAYEANETEEMKVKSAALGATLVSFEDLLKNSDVITLHIPLLDSTKDLIKIDQLKQMKKTAFIINTSRGGVINEEDLYTALKEKIIAGAATDVFVKEKEKTPLFELDNLVVTPHIGAMTYDSQKAIAEILCENISNFVDGKPIINKLK